MYTKLFSRITESSLMEEPLEVRYTFVMLLAICDQTGHVIGTNVAIARRINMPLADFERCLKALMAPDEHSNSREEDGRRVVLSDGERGLKVVNYVTYRDMKSDEEKRNYMREYMRKRREAQRLKEGVKPRKTLLTDVTHTEAEAEAVPPNPQRGNGAGITEGNDSKNIPTTEQSKRIAKIFHRREKTPWQTNEVRAYKKLGTIPDEDLTAVEAYYAANWPPCRDKNILRHDLLTFLNNFQGEVGRAYAAKEKPTTKPHDKRQHLHSNGATGLANAPGRYDTHGPSFRERLANLEPAPQIPGLQPAAGPHPG